MKNTIKTQVKNQTRLNKKAFSLVELLVVITIMAILSVVAYQALGGQTAKARNAKRKEALTTLQSSLEIYALTVSTNNKYPTEAEYKTGAPVKYELVEEKLMNKMPKDPSNIIIDYIYKVAGDGKSYQLAASLEDDRGGSDYKAYVIGNSNINLITTGRQWNGVAWEACGNVVDDTICLPYEL